MSITIVVLIVCLCLVSFVLGMIAMAFILHPYRQETKRLRKRNMELKRYQQRMQKINQ